MVINVIQTKVERLEVAIILRVILEAALGRGVQSAAGNLVNPNLPGPGKSSPLNMSFIIHETRSTLPGAPPFFY